MVNSQLVQESIDEQTYWASPDTQEVADTPHVVFLLPSFDEYLVGYRDRSAVLDPAHAKQAVPGGGILSATVVVDGQVVGVWKRRIKRDRIFPGGGSALSA